MGLPDPINRLRESATAFETVQEKKYKIFTSLFLITDP